MAIVGCASIDNTQSKKEMYKKSIVHGATISAGFTAASSLLGSAIHPDNFKAAVKQCGGTGNYFKRFGVGLAITALMGSALSLAMTFVGDKYVQYRNKALCSDKANQ